MIGRAGVHIVAFAALAVAGCVQRTAATAALQLNPAETAMLHAINEYRAERNLPRLEPDARLCVAADEHNRMMRDRIQILGLQAGTTHWGHLGRRIRDAGYEYTYASENVAAGHGVAAPDLFQGLLDSPSHHANIVSPRARAIGLSVRREGHAVFITQEFAAP